MRNKTIILCLSYIVVILAISFYLYSAIVGIGLMLTDDVPDEDHWTMAVLNCFYLFCALILIIAVIIAIIAVVCGAFNYIVYNHRRA